MGGGSNPWNIPPFNWYGKGVIAKINTSSLITTFPDSISSDTNLTTILDITGKGILYGANFYNPNTVKAVLKVTLDSIPCYWYYISGKSICGFSTITPNYTLEERSRIISQCNTISTVVKRNTDMDFTTATDNIVVPFPLLFENSLKIEGAIIGMNASNSIINYAYDLFNEQ